MDSSVDLDQVYRAIHTLYSNNVDSLSHQEKQAASSWLNEMQKSVILFCGLFAMYWLYDFCFYPLVL